MTTVASLAAIAALIGDPARAAILVTLMDGRALTAGELAAAAGVAPSTASLHLGRMLDAGLLALERQGRHRYYRIAGATVAALLESMMSLSSALREAAGQHRPVRTGPSDLALRRARLCYDHLAGELAVGVTASLLARGHVEFGPDGGAVTLQGIGFLASAGIQIDAEARERARKTAFCRPCLDWSERRPHIAGVVGRALHHGFVRNGWVRQVSQSRIVSITPLGLAEINRCFGVTIGGIR